MKSLYDASAVVVVGPSVKESKCSAMEYRHEKVRTERDELKFYNLQFYCLYESGEVSVLQRILHH